MQSVGFTDDQAIVKVSIAAKTDRITMSVVLVSFVFMSRLLYRAMPFQALPASLRTRANERARSHTSKGQKSQANMPAGEDDEHDLGGADRPSATSVDGHR